VLRRVRASVLKDIGSEELAVTFETLQRIEARASRLQDAKTAAAKTASDKTAPEAK
jgi:MarR family transcriptional regulator for hemolysin